MIQSNLIESIANQSINQCESERERVKYCKHYGSDGGIESKSIADVSCSF